jgi:hypothetical protein
MKKVLPPWFAQAMTFSFHIRYSLCRRIFFLYTKMWKNFCFFINNFVCLREIVHGAVKLCSSGSFKNKQKLQEKLLFIHNIVSSLLPYSIFTQVFSFFFSVFIERFGLSTTTSMFCGK